MNVFVLDTAQTTEPTAHGAASVAQDFRIKGFHYGCKAKIYARFLLHGMTLKTVGLGTDDFLRFNAPLLWIALCLQCKEL